MKRLISVIIAGAGLILLVGVATAHWGEGPGTGRWGGAMGHGHGIMRGGGYGCPGSEATNAQITEEKAKELAQQYADQYLAGYKVERVLPFTGMHHTMYSVELKSEDGELRTLHVNPFGNVMPFGGSWQRRS